MDLRKPAVHVEMQRKDASLNNLVETEPKISEHPSQAAFTKVTVSLLNSHEPSLEKERRSTDMLEPLIEITNLDSKNTPRLTTRLNEDLPFTMSGEVEINEPTKESNANF